MKWLLPYLHQPCHLCLCLCYDTEIYLVCSWLDGINISTNIQQIFNKYPTNIQQIFQQTSSPPGIQKPTWCAGGWGKRHAASGRIDKYEADFELKSWSPKRSEKVDGAYQGRGTVSLPGANQELLTLGNTWYLTNHQHDHWSVTKMVDVPNWWPITSMMNVFY